MQFGRGIFVHHLQQMSITCARGVISRWNTQLKMASMGLI
jgi:hypothetical protein